MGVPVEVLRRVPLFSAVEPDELSELAARFTERVYDQGSPVVSRGRSGEGFFIIAEGEATVDVAGKCAHLRKNDFFGEIALIDGGRRSADITADTNMRCWGISRKTFRAFVQQHPGVAWSMLEVCAQRLRAADAAAVRQARPARRRRFALRHRTAVR